MRLSLKAGALNLAFAFLLPLFSFAQLQKIFLQPKAPGNAKQSKFVDSLHFYPLEIRDDLNLQAYADIEVSERYFMLIDNGKKYVSIYAKDGRFLKKVSFKSLGDGFYPSYREKTNEVVFFGNNRKYSLTSKDQIKIRLDWNNPKNRKYFKKYSINLNDTTFKLKNEMPGEMDLIQAVPFYEDYYWQSNIITSPIFKTTEAYEIKIYQDKKLVQKYFPYDRVNEPRFQFAQESASFSRTSSPSTNFIFRPLCDTIFKMVRDSLFPALQLVMPLDNSIPPKAFAKPFKNKTERENFNRNNGWMFNHVFNFYEAPDFYYLGVAFNNNYETYIYQKQGSSTYKSKSVKADSSQYNLQLLTEISLANRSGRFYKAIKAGDLISFFDQNKNVAVPKELEEYLKRKPHNAAPVIVEFKLKETP